MHANNISILNFKDISNEEVDQIKLFLDQSNIISVFHTLEWNQCIYKIFKTQFEVAVFRDNKGEIISMISYHVINDSKKNINIYSPPAMYEIPYGGFLFKNDKCNFQKEVIDSFLNYFPLHYKRCACFITGMPGLNFSTSTLSHKIRNLKTPIVNLLPAEDEIWSSFNSKRRNMVRKAEKNNVEIVIGGTDLLEDYYKMVTSLYKKMNKAPLTIDYYSEILKTFYPNGIARIFLSKYQDGFLSGGIFLKYKNTGYYWHGASFANTPNLGQNELLQWEVMKRFKSEGCTKYDLVRVEEEKLPNIALFKMGFTNITEEFYDIYCVTTKNKIIRKIFAILN